MNGDFFSRETAAAVAEAVRPWLLEDVDEPPPVPPSSCGALRAAEAAPDGGQVATCVGGRA